MGLVGQDTDKEKFPLDSSGNVLVVPARWPPLVSWKPELTRAKLG